MKNLSGFMMVNGLANIVRKNISESNGNFFGSLTVVIQQQNETTLEIKKHYIKVNTDGDNAKQIKELNNGDQIFIIGTLLGDVVNLTEFHTGKLTKKTQEEMSSKVKPYKAPVKPVQQSNPVQQLEEPVNEVNSKSVPYLPDLPDLSIQNERPFKPTQQEAPITEQQSNSVPDLPDFTTPNESSVVDSQYHEVPVNNYELDTQALSENMNSELPPVSLYNQDDFNLPNMNDGLEDKSFINNTTNNEQYGLTSGDQLVPNDFDDDVPF